MILDFDDSCWTETNADWQRSLITLLIELQRFELHSVLAKHQAMLGWCTVHLPLFRDYYRTRLMSAQNRSTSLHIFISPQGGQEVLGPPPWELSAAGAADIVNRPLRLVLENDESDRCFLESTVSSFSTWCTRSWLVPEMGGGSAMGAKIKAAGANTVDRWRTFFVFDSDRLHPSELAVGWAPPRGDGCQGHQFEQHCADIPLKRWHRLERRSIENYLPDVVLQPLNPNLTATLFSNAVGTMAHFYNMKQGLRGDGVSSGDPKDLEKKLVRASRSQGMWTGLSQNEAKHLEPGFGKDVAEEFKNVPKNFSWSLPVRTEMNRLADALQDAM